MAFDFKKEFKEFYMPKNKPAIVTVPKVNYIAVRGKGNLNEAGGAYQQAISVLYAVAYTLIQSMTLPHFWKHSLSSMQQLQKKSLLIMYLEMCLNLSVGTTFILNW